MFRKYMHIERLGNDAVEGILIGTCWIFPKIDGTNGTVWFEDGQIKAGSRNRELTLDNDNAGFCNWIIKQQNIRDFLLDHPTLRLYGEWLVPHTLKTYRRDAWNKYYVFDVYDDQTGKYLAYPTYNRLLESYGIDYIIPLAKIINPSTEQLINLINNNTYLIEDGKGAGEGIVIKNYSYVNRYGRQIWAKMVRNQFKDEHRRAEIKGIRGEITDEERFCEIITENFVSKVYYKIKHYDGWSNEKIPILLSMCYYDLINEELWDFMKKRRNNVVLDFKKLYTMVTARVKDIFFNKILQENA